MPVAVTLVVSAEDRRWPRALVVEGAGLKEDFEYPSLPSVGAFMARLLNALGHTVDTSGLAGWLDEACADSSADVTLAAEGGLSRLSLALSEDWGDCDDCGPYADETLTLSGGGEALFSLWKDGHLGGGASLADVGKAIADSLRRLGYEAAVSERVEARQPTRFSGHLLDEQRGREAAMAEAALSDDSPPVLDFDDCQMVSGWWLNGFVWGLADAFGPSFPKGFSVRGGRALAEAVDWLDKQGRLPEGWEGPFLAARDGALVFNPAEPLK
jgi:hypothetical protein